MSAQWWQAGWGSVEVSQRLVEPDVLWLFWHVAHRVELQTGAGATLPR